MDKKMKHHYGKFFALFLIILAATLIYHPSIIFASTPVNEEMPTENHDESPQDPDQPPPEKGEGEEPAPPPAFTEDDKFFQVVGDKVPIYKNTTGKLVKVGELVKGQVYPRLRDDGDWHEISFGDTKGYVPKTGTQPVEKHNLKNLNKKLKLSGLYVKISKNATVYDNSSGQPVPFAFLVKGQTYPIIDHDGSYWLIDVAGRIGYIPKNLTQTIVKPVVKPEQKYSYQQMEKDIHLLEMMYSDIIETKIIGQSVEGRNIYAIKLGTGKKEVMINAAHHAREHITTNLIMKMLDEYAYAYHKNRKIDGYNVQKVLKTTSIWFVPMVNPDGVTLVQYGHKAVKYASQALKINGGKTNFSAWKANIRGVDLNRQYPTLWKTIVNDPGKPAPQNYKGAKPLSEPEAQALYNFTKSRKFRAVISYHSSGELNLSRLDAAPGARKLGQKISQKTKYPLINISKRKSGGGFSDWFAVTYKKPAFTLEVAPYAGPGPVPIKQWDRVWKRNNSVGLILAHHAP